MDEFHSFMRFLVAPLVLFIPMTPIISLLAILPGVQYGWVTHSLRMISINVVADELIRSMGWNDVRPRVIRVSNAMYDTLYPFYYADAWRLLMGFAAAARIIMEAYRISALDNIYMMYCNALVEAPNPSNPDIIGMGVRLSTYVLLLGVFASLFIGSFHSGPSGTKELGVATLINLLSLAVNLLKADIEDLTPTDVFIVIVMIDTHCVTLSATLSSKEALASRFYVRLVMIGQAIAWAAVLYADIEISNRKWPSYPWDDHVCDKDWFDSIVRIAGQHPFLPFRPYWISHAYDLIQPSVLAACHTGHFDKLEKIDRDHQDRMGGQDENQTGYSRLPSTAFSTWTGFVLYPVLLIVSVEHHLWRYETDMGGVREWGQSVSIITCVCGILHWVYVNYPLLGHPFRCVWQGRWIPRKGPVLPINIMRLIAVRVTPSSVGEENYKLLTADRPW